MKRRIYIEEDLKHWLEANESTENFATVSKYAGSILTKVSRGKGKGKWNYNAEDAARGV